MAWQHSLARTRSQGPSQQGAAGSVAQSMHHIITGTAWLIASQQFGYLALQLVRPYHTFRGENTEAHTVSVMCIADHRRQTVSDTKAIDHLI